MSLIPDRDMQRLGLVDVAPLQRDESLLSQEQLVRIGILDKIAAIFNVPELQRDSRVMTALGNQPKFQEVAKTYNFSYYSPPHRMGGTSETAVYWNEAFKVIGKWFLMGSGNEDRWDHEVGTMLFRALTIEVDSPEWNEWTDYVIQKESPYHYPKSRRNIGS